MVLQACFRKRRSVSYPAKSTRLRWETVMALPDMDPPPLSLSLPPSKFSAAEDSITSRKMVWLRDDLRIKR